MRLRRPGFAPLALGVLLLASGCASQRIDRAMASANVGDLDTARSLLEAERSRQPDSAKLRIALGIVYYRTAREALDRRGEEARYLAYLERSIEEFVAAARLEPANPDPHFYLAVADAYRGDLRSALLGLKNSWRLRPTGVACTNLGEAYVYLGNTAEARRWTLRGLRQGAGAGPVTFNRMLIDWKDGDLGGARNHFRTLWKYHPEMISTINEAPVPREPETFEEFAAYCCGSPACGPYLERRCADLGFAVVQRELSNESVLRELRIEMEKQRRLREIYEQRKDLELEIEDPERPPGL